MAKMLKIVSKTVMYGAIDISSLKSFTINDAYIKFYFAGNLTSQEPVRMDFYGETDKEIRKEAKDILELLHNNIEFINK